MEKTCTLCKFTTHSDFQWDLHYISDTHELAALRAERDALRKALENTAFALESVAVMDGNKEIEIYARYARRALDAK